jgi:hypothetical protein
MTHPTDSLTKSLLGKIGLDGFSLAVIVWAPAYDGDSERVAHWLDDLSIPWGATQCLSIGTNLNRHTVLADLRKTAQLRRIQVFLGHSNSDSLLGPPQGDSLDILEGDSPYAPIYDAAMMDDNPGALFAFGCNAGNQLGKDFSKPQEGSFLGFSAEIFIPVLDSNCRKTWRDIIRKLIDEIIKGRSILAEHEELLRILYEKAMHYYSEGEGQNNENAFYYVLQLNWQNESIVRFP